MLALAAFLFAILPFLIILAAMPLANAMSALVLRICAEPSSEHFSVLSVELASGPDHSLIWETQVPMLQLISESGLQGLPIRNLRKSYRESARHYPEIYDGFTFTQWLKFLEGARLVARTGKRMFLAAKGHHILHERTRAAATPAPARLV